MRRIAVLIELRGSYAAERMGASLRAADIDGDGSHEILVGAGLADAKAATAGRVLLLGRKYARSLWALAPFARERPFSLHAHRVHAVGVERRGGRSAV